MIAHTHDTTEPETGSAAAAAAASVAVDVGRGHGALIIYPAEHYRGREIEISPVDMNGPRVHTGVHDRTTAAGHTRLTAVFGRLAAGDYLIWADAVIEGPVVTVPEAAVAELTLD